MSCKKCDRTVPDTSNQKWIKPKNETKIKHTLMYILGGQSSLICPSTSPNNKVEIKHGLNPLDKIPDVLFK